jgi:hypothetical protein
MTITVTTETPENGTPRVRAFASGKEATGATIGAAIDALHLMDDMQEGDEPYIVIQRFRADRFFPEPQRTRLKTLMQVWRVARDAGEVFPARLQEELDVLVAVEQEAMIARSQYLLEKTRK